VLFPFVLLPPLSREHFPAYFSFFKADFCGFSSVAVAVAVAGVWYDRVLHFVFAKKKNGRAGCCGCVCVLCSAVWVLAERGKKVSMRYRTVS